MKVAELEGALLDYWVARAEGMSPYVEGRFSADNKYCRVYAGDCGENGYSPSTDWAQGGPIIERLIAQGWGITPDGQDGFSCSNMTSALMPYDGNFDKDFMSFDADTVLIAAMRAYVASKFGDTIEDS